MLAINASSISHSDSWRQRDQKTMEKSTLHSWRERRESKGNGEVKESLSCSRETKEMSGNWRFRKERKATREDVAGVYGDCMPAEWKLQRMYKQLKTDTNRFTTWLVESVYPCPEDLPCSESLPPYITLSPKQAKGMSKPDQVGDIEFNLTDLDRPPQIRHNCQQHHRCCPSDKDSTHQHNRPPRTCHHGANRILALDVSQINRRSCQSHQRKTLVLYRGPGESEGHLGRANGGRNQHIIHGRL